jgi:hypothetical protein
VGEECFNAQKYSSVTGCLEDATHCFLITINKKHHRIVAKVSADLQQELRVA